VTGEQIRISKNRDARVADEQMRISNNTVGMDN
jgi:hypothetical protein